MEIEWTEWTRFWVVAGVIMTIFCIVSLVWARTKFNERKRRSDFLTKCAKEYSWEKAREHFTHIGLFPEIKFRELRQGYRVTDEALAAALWRIIVEQDPREDDILDAILLEFYTIKRPGSFHAFAVEICSNAPNSNEQHELVERFRFCYESYSLEQKIKRQKREHEERKRKEEMEWSNFVRLFQKPSRLPGRADVTNNKDKG